MSIIVRTCPAVNPSRKGLAPDYPSFEPTTEDQTWWANESNRTATDFDVVEDESLEWPGTREEFEEWLTSLEPSQGELESRDRCDAYLGEIA